MEHIKGLAHIGVYTHNLDASLKFYRDLLGFQEKSREAINKPDGSVIRLAFMHFNDVVVELIEPSDKTGLPREGDGNPDHIALGVKDLPALVEKLRKEGVVFETEEPVVLDELFGGVRLIFLRGPSGERLEFFEYLNL